MTHTEAYDSMQRIVNEFGSQEAAKIMASMLERRQHSYMQMAREGNWSTGSTVTAVLEAGRAKREAEVLRCASLDLGGKVEVRKPSQRKDSALVEAWEKWTANDLFVNGNNGLSSYTDPPCRSRKAYARSARSLGTGREARCWSAARCPCTSSGSTLAMYHAKPSTEKRPAHTCSQNHPHGPESTSVSRSGFTPCSIRHRDSAPLPQQRSSTGSPGRTAMCLAISGANLRLLPM